MELEIISVFTGLNFWLISLFTGIILFIVRKVVDTVNPKLEKNEFYKLVITIMPFLLGMVLAFVPGLRITEVLAQSIILGIIAGSVSGSTYPFVKRFLRLFLKQKENAVKGEQNVE